MLASQKRGAWVAWVALVLVWCSLILGLVGSWFGRDGLPLTTGFVVAALTVVATNFYFRHLSQILVKQTQLVDCSYCNGRVTRYVTTSNRVVKTEIRLSATGQAVVILRFDERGVIGLVEVRGRLRTQSLAVLTASVGNKPYFSFFDFNQRVGEGRGWEMDLVLAAKLLACDPSDFGELADKVATGTLDEYVIEWIHQILA